VRIQSGNQLPDYPITRLPDSRSAGDIGREARVELVFERRGNRTIVAHAYAEPPFRISRTFAIDDAAFVIVACTGPGVIGGDTIELSVDVRPGARVMLTSQAALQAHPSRPAATARLVQRFAIAEDGELHCQWDPLIPFAGSRVDQRFAICAARGARVYWSDALMAGRAMRGEAWQFDQLAHELRFERAGVCEYLERYRLTPAERDAARTWAAGDDRYFATALLLHADATGEAAERLHRVLASVPDVRAAADRLEPGLIVCRVAARFGPRFAAARAAVRAAALSDIFHSPHLVVRK